MTARARSGMRWGIAAVLFLAISLAATGEGPATAAPTATAATTTAPAAAAATTTAPAAAAAPVAQAAALPPGFGDEMPKPENPWRRFEIVSLGAFPISLFYVGFGFDLGHYAASSFDSRYAPWPFQSSTSILPTDSERLVRIGSAAALSLVIGGIDAIIHAQKLRAERRRAAAETIELDSKGAGD